MGSPATPASTTAQLHAVRACEHVGGGAAGEEVRDHLPCHRLRVGGDALVRDAVVPGEQGEAAAMQVGVRVP